MTKRHWTLLEDNILKKTYPTNPTVEVAIFFARPVKAVYNRAMKLGLTKTPAFIRSTNTQISRNRHQIILNGAQTSSNTRHQSL